MLRRNLGVIDDLVIAYLLEQDLGEIVVDLITG